MSETLFHSFLPSAPLFAIAGGLIVLVIGALLLQRAARAHWREQRRDRLRTHVGRVEAQWNEAAM
jgi:small neutral amino acid transporter SnatA (MarC family)